MCRTWPTRILTEPSHPPWPQSIYTAAFRERCHCLEAHTSYEEELLSSGHSHPQHTLHYCTYSFAHIKFIDCFYLSRAGAQSNLLHIVLCMKPRLVNLVESFRVSYMLCFVSQKPHQDDFQHLPLRLWRLACSLSCMFTAHLSSERVYTRQGSNFTKQMEMEHIFKMYFTVDYFAVFQSFATIVY